MDRQLNAETDQPRLSAGVVIALIAGLWLFYFALSTARGSVVGLELGQELLWRRALVTLAGAVVTYVMWLVLRLFDARPLWNRIVAALVLAMPAAMLIGQINTFVFAPLEGRAFQQIGRSQGVNLRQDEAGNILLDLPPVGDSAKVGEGNVPESLTIAKAPTAEADLRQLVAVALDRYYLLLAFCALYLALLAGAQARAALAREERFRSAAKAAELRSLRYQVNPHFLFNTLNSLSALVMTGKAERAEQMIQTISNFYRHSLADDPTGDVSLEDEIGLQEQYLAIESVRFPERLKVAVALPPELAGCKVPGMILQPLVENSVKYGVSASARPVTIAIDAREEGGQLVLTVADDGPGAGQGASGFGIGLANVRDRLHASFGDEASIVSAPCDTGYRTELRLPLVKHV